jgi:hypothetical protein
MNGEVNGLTKEFFGNTPGIQKLNMDFLKVFREKMDERFNPRASLDCILLWNL